jgi:hypothetical protein
MAPRTTNTRRSRRRWLPSIIAAALAAVAAIGILVHTVGTGSASPAPASQLLAPVTTSATGSAVDGIQCQTTEQALYHVHSHLAVYVNGASRTIPAGIGITPPQQVVQTADGPFVGGGTCLYWLHSHTQDGIIHIESPVQRTYTLGNWFDIWGQPLSATQAGPAQGNVTAYVNGQRYTGNPRDIVLGDHTVIQLDVGADVAPQSYTFPQGL